MNENALLVFAKAPVAGYVKTRLIPALNADGAAKLHEQLVYHTLQNLVNPTQWDTLLWCGGDEEHAFFQQCILDFKVTSHAQQGDDLGQRMFHAANHSLKTYRSICIIGTDCPVLEAKNVSQAFDALNRADIVFNPAEDGGYVLIAANSVDRRVFDNIAWGTSDVLEQSLNHVKALGLRSTLLPTLWDVDNPEDLKKLGNKFNY